MARFRAYTTDSEDDEDIQSVASSSERGEVESKADSSIAVEEEGGEEEEEEAPAPRPRYATRARQQADSEDSELSSRDEEEDAQSESSQSSTAPRRDFQVPGVVPWAHGVGVDPNRMHVMQQSLFRMPEEAEAMKDIATFPSRKKLLLSNLNRKHSRDSDGGEGLRADSRQRASFAHDIEPPPYRPSRKYARVESSASAVAGNESTLIDSGLSMGRSFRVGWGPGGRLVHLGSLCGPYSPTCSTANSSVVTIISIPVFSTSEEIATDRASRLLSHHLSNTPVEPDAEGVPCAVPSNKLTFSSFASLFPATDTSLEASLFRLGRALFDPLDLQLADSITVDIRNKVELLRRKSALSDWLQAVVSPSVDAELRDNRTGPWAQNVFSLLTGNQIEKASELAISAGNVRLATLLSQCPGDEDFKEDLRAQLTLWREQRIDAHFDENTRKVYALLAGLVGTLEGSGGAGIERARDLALPAGLDWKRAFGLHLWFGEPLEAPLADVFESYRISSINTTLVAPPKPWYAEPSVGDERPSAWKLPTGLPPPDALYSLIRLFADPACSLSSILEPFSFGPSPIDWRLSWHLYILLSRCLRIRDFADRGDPGTRRDEGEDDGIQVEGHSPSADLLANSYAMQLEQLGLIQEAVFILLHIEGSVGRKRAIKELLVRSASKLDDWMIRGLVGSLKIPMTWINEATAIFALDNGDVFAAYELYLAAGLYGPAHDIAVLKLAPDAVIRQDLDLLRTLFTKIYGHPVDDWQDRGKLFLDYVDAMTRLPELQASLEEVNAVPDTAQATEFEELTRSVPKLIALLPSVLPDRSDVRYNAAISEMITGLTLRLDKVRPLAVQNQSRDTLVPEPTRLRHIHATAYEKFLRTIEVA